MNRTKVKLWQKMLLLGVLLIFSQQLFSQVKGKVSDATGAPIPGVTIVEKGTSNGVISNFEGVYEIKVQNAQGAILVYSFVGMTSSEIPVAGKTTVNVTLSETTIDIEQVVVVGYGTQKKVSVTGAVASIPMAQLKQSPVASLANALAGRLPGLTSIQSGGGQPGHDDATMYLRGAATTNGRAPLILIDGVPRDNIRTIDANEVESVSILKDASATAVFGVRGANGVILITTRRGKEGKTELTINAVESFTSFTREPERLHSLDYMRLRNEASANDNISPLPFSKAVMDKYANPTAGLDPKDPDYANKAKILNYMYPDHDYYRETISRFSPSTRINGNASGGTDKVTYFINAAYFHQGGNLKAEPKSVLGYDPSSKMDRYNFRANLDYKVSNSVKAFLNIGSYIEQVNMPSAGLYGDDTNWMMTDLIYQAQTILPITPGPTTLPGFGEAPGQIVYPTYLDRTAFEIMNRYGYRNEVRSNLNTTFGINWDLGNLVTKGLTTKGMFSYDSKSTSAEQGYKNERQYSANVDVTTDQLTYAVSRANESLLSITKGVDSRYNINMQGSVNYSRTFGSKHTVGGMVLAQRDYWETTAGEIPYNVVGVASRATYAYDNRYLGEVNMGYNGSEQFAPGNRYGFFPAVSLGWVASNERFLKDNRIITNLKLRASYGKVGNDQMGSSRFLYQSNITVVGGGPLGSLGLGNTVSQGLLGNTEIGWEVAKKQNYGVDVQLIKDFNIAFDYFIENRSNILISRGTVPVFQGVPLVNLPKVNMGLVDNHGFDVEVTYNKTLSRDFSLNVMANYGFNRNKVKFMDEQIRDSTYMKRYSSTGYAIGQATGYAIDYSNGNGYFNSQEELTAYLAKTKYGSGSPRVGDFKYIDQNGDGVVDSKDVVPIGYSNIPEIAYGLTINLQYKSFALTTFFQGVSHYSSNYSSQGIYENTKQGTYFGYTRTAWTQERYAAGEKITYPALSTLSNSNHRANSFFIMDRSFLRLKNIELAYTLPVNALNILGVKNMRIFVSGDNLFTWAHLRMDHLDPETSGGLTYQETKMLNIGANITF